MSIQDWGAVGEIVGAIAVVVTLLYLTTQIRQNTRSLRNAASSSINDALLQLNSRWAENPDGLVEIWVRGCADLGSLTPVERERWEHHAFDLLNLATYIDHTEQENLADAHMDWIQYMKMLIYANPGLRQFMVNLKEGWGGSRELYDRLMEEPEVKLTPGPGTTAVDPAD